ncbi:hypothetical protein RND81_02G158900 [Saponaria officinalis]|uniref:SWIM-type domain-containing protein n=1 Tax=Saponaria officinalis TaxID=3572 RepID=A0AAW1MLV8_SAPOF
MKSKEWKHLLIVYRRHAQAMGFSARIGTCRRKHRVDSPEYERYFICSCQGEHGNCKPRDTVAAPKAKKSNTKKVNITRCECRVSIRTQINSEGLWQVRDHKIDHNHPLTPTQWQHHHRKITGEEGEIIEIMIKAMVSPSVQYRVAAATFRGEEFVGHTKRDHINFVNRLKMHAIEGGDASTLVNLLNKRQTEEPGFFYRVQFGEGGRLCHLFWRDSMMKEDYLLYHDVWLFKAFNESMGEDVIPISIFTDQDLAMANAIEKVYPISKHRLCQWHIHQNAISQFGSLKNERTFQNAFNKCLNGCYMRALNMQCGSKRQRQPPLLIFLTFLKLRLRGGELKRNTTLLKFILLLIFKVFEKEFGMAIGTRVVECAFDESLSLYIVHSSGSFKNSQQVTFDHANLTIECTCRKFTEMGTFCYHSIRILHLRSITEIPDRYILKRWTKFTKNDVWDRLLPNDRRRVGINDAINWRKETLTNFNNLITKCQNVVEARTILEQAYAKANDAVQAFFNTTGDVECPTSLETPTTSLILDPQHSTTKGRSRRKKSGITKRRPRGTKQS